MRGRVGAVGTRTWNWGVVLGLLVASVVRAEGNAPSPAQCLSKEHLSRLLGTIARLAPVMVEDIRDDYDYRPTQADVKVEVELMRARLPRDAFPIPYFYSTHGKASCLTASWRWDKKGKAPEKVTWRACPTEVEEPPAKIRPYYVVMAQLLVDCQGQSTALTFARSQLVLPEDQGAMLSAYDVWLLLSDDGARFREVLTGCLPGGAKQLAGRVDVSQGTRRVAWMCFPYYMANPDGPKDMLLPWEAFKSDDKREGEIELLGSIEFTP